MIESFNYCGISTSVISEYHSQLIQLIRNYIIPSYTTAYLRDETDEFGDFFVITERWNREDDIIDIIVEKFAAENILKDKDVGNGIKNNEPKDYSNTGGSFDIGAEEWMDDDTDEECKRKGR